MAQGLDPTQIDQALGAFGAKTGDVYRVSFPRTDLQVAVGGSGDQTRPRSRFLGCIIGTNADSSVIGDLVRLESEINPCCQIATRGFGR